MSDRIQTFFITWFIILLLNQIFIFHACFKPYCILAALPHTGIIAFILMVIMAKGEEENGAKGKRGGKSSGQLVYENFDTHTNDNPIKKSKKTKSATSSHGKKRKRFERFVKKQLEQKKGGTIIEVIGGIDFVHIDDKHKSINLIRCNPYRIESVASILTTINRFDMEKVIDTDIDINAYAIHKTLYLGAKKNNAVEQENTLEKIKLNIYRYKDLKIVLLENSK